MEIIDINRLPKEMREGNFGEAISAFNDVISLTIERNLNNIDLLLLLFDPTTEKPIELKFSEIRNLEISDISQSDFQTTVLYVEDISERQMENVNWEIRNHEDFKFQFCCKSISVISYNNNQ